MEIFDASVVKDADVILACCTCTGHCSSWPTSTTGVNIAMYQYGWA